MTETEQIILDELIHSRRTSHLRDRVVQAHLLRGAKSPSDRAFIAHMIVDARMSWLNWLTRTQRDWQTKVSRRPSRTRHHDSWSIREGYVRCIGGL